MKNQKWYVILLKVLSYLITLLLGVLGNSVL